MLFFIKNDVSVYLFAKINCLSVRIQDRGQRTDEMKASLGTAKTFISIYVGCWPRMCMGSYVR